jgi:phosphocarrier protein FPr
MTGVEERLALSTGVHRHCGARGTRGFVVAPVRQIHTADHPSMDNGDNQLPAAGRCILVAQDLTPADTAALDLGQIAAFCTAEGGPTSHAVQVAYSLGIPTVVAAGDDILAIPDGQICALDGDAGILYAGLQGQDLDAATAFEQSLSGQAAARTASDQVAVVRPAGVTITGTLVRLSQAADLAAVGAHGLGLLASELLFLGREEHLTDEEEHYRAYCSVAEAAGDAPVTVRTLDIGGDKPFPSLDLREEDNAFLGVRGVRLSLRRPDLFRPQLRAIYRAARDTKSSLRVMFPMVTTVEEFTAAAAVAEQVRAELSAPTLALGVMVEVPACALAADLFAAHVDFFSIGTNDLAQYVMAASRTNPDLAHDIDPMNCAVLRTVRMVTEAASARQIPVSACGGLAGDPVGAVVLAALGVTSLTVALPSIPAVRGALERLDEAALEAIRDQALSQGGGAHLEGFVTALAG